MVVQEATRPMAGVLRRFAALLVEVESELNAVNVFPVPDRDTGTNLRRTVEAMVADLEAAGTDDLAAAVALAALNGARGNSGLICAQYLAGLLADEPERLLEDASALTRGLALGAERARAAVANPVEGTMITVADAAADAVASLSPTDGVIAVVTRAHEAATRSLVDTPSLLPILAQAGVVDAGAAGLLRWFDALAEAVGAPVVPSASPLALGAVSDDDVAPVGTGNDRDHADRESVSPVAAGGTGSFEVQFTADGDEALARRLRALLAAWGTDVVVSQAGAVLRAHVHTDAPGPVVEAVLDVARPRNLSIEAIPAPLPSTPNGTAVAAGGAGAESSSAVEATA